MKELLGIAAFTLLSLAVSAQAKQKDGMNSTALLLIDIQNDYFDGGKMPLFVSTEAAENARKVLQKFRMDTLSVIHIQHVAMLPTATFFLPDTRGVQIHDYVKPSAQEKVIVKHYPNSFRETELLSYLKAKHISKLVICGMMTHMCVDATVRAAKDFGFDVTVIGDACATTTLEIAGEMVDAREVQKSFLAALNYFYSTVESTEQYVYQKQ